MHMQRKWKDRGVNLMSTVLLALGLAAWIALPWMVLLPIGGLLAVWLLVTRSGRLSLAAARIGIATLPQRWGSSSVIVVGIAGVVGVLVAMLAMGQGFQATLNSTGDDTTAIVLRGGSQAETNSVITRDLVPLISSLPGIAADANGHSLLSPELSQVVNIASRSDGTDVNAQLRGVGEQAWAVHDKIKIVQGRRFNTGLREMVVGKGALNQFRGLELGKTLTLGSQQWTVVGVFASGDAHDSEMWTDAQTLATTYNRSAYQSISVRTTGKQGFSAFKTAMAADPRLKLDVETTRAYYGKQGGGLNKLISILGTVIGTIMAVGAVFGALNTMYAAVATRAREIATMRAIGFRGTPVIMALMLETMLLALLGGLLGGVIAWAVFNGYTVSTLGNNFSQVVFQFKVSPELLWSGLKWALGIGLVGGLFPALRAARLPITTALREV
ncbi:membrane protein [Xanthomonas vasicola pv. musacearum NCPPB 2005]|nr:membrane protein [Xanthomonas vasicola pv. musacearum NCPPB 4380]KFA12695.1 membrane protein [Xanthomonas vasicola pv. musacearum NCPPB 2005]KFA16460.1 membrane protein [Xanthomonas vasicola pv. musacearum NCPPB 4392]KFA21360.1 membrane protein [Xanthomonas vasicola pv. musacearum NCPPB 4394]KFA31097.1 membrane protein [Xanthomonas vasicola pv. musacearum NCPPB 4384]